VRQRRRLAPEVHVAVHDSGGLDRDLSDREGKEHPDEFAMKIPPAFKLVGSIWLAATSDERGVVGHVATGYTTSAVETHSFLQSWLMSRVNGAAWSLCLAPEAHAFPRREVGSDNYCSRLSSWDATQATVLARLRTTRFEVGRHAEPRRKESVVLTER
jgi:hypothetical protein